MKTTITTDFDDELTTMDNSVSEDENTLEAFLAEYTKPEYLAIEKTLNTIDLTHDMLFEGGVHCVHGLAGEGKTYFVLGLLNALAASRKVMWLDGDNNGIKMAQRFSNVQHIPPARPNEWLERLIDKGCSLENTIIILDSLKDFSFELDSDNNKGSNAILQKYKLLSNMGATLVIITHSTALREGGKVVDIKLRGNEEGIKSNTDVVYMFEQDWEANKRTITVQKSRIDGVKKGDKHIQDGLSWVKLPITDNSVSTEKSPKW